MNSDLNDSVHSMNSSVYYESEEDITVINCSGMDHLSVDGTSNTVPKQLFNSSFSHEFVHSAGSGNMLPSPSFSPICNSNDWRSYINPATNLPYKPVLPTLSDIVKDDKSTSVGEAQSHLDDSLTMSDDSRPASS